MANDNDEIVGGAADNDLLNTDDDTDVDAEETDEDGLVSESGEELEDDVADENTNPTAAPTKREEEDGM